MENKKGLPFGFVLMAIIIGIALFNEFNFDTFKFENLALAVVYFIGFGLSVLFSVKELLKK